MFPRASPFCILDMCTVEQLMSVLQARVEVGILQMLNSKADPGNKHHIVRMCDFFVHRLHLCLVFELLAVNLYELIKRNQFRGLSIGLLRVFITQARLLSCASSFCSTSAALVPPVAWTCSNA